MLKTPKEIQTPADASSSQGERLSPLLPAGSPLPSSLIKASLQDAYLVAPPVLQRV